MFITNIDMNSIYQHDLKKLEFEPWTGPKPGVRRTPSSKERAVAKAARKQQRISRKRNRK